MTPDKRYFLRSDLCYLPFHHLLQSFTKAITDLVSEIPDKLTAPYRELTPSLLSLHSLSVVVQQREAERSPFWQFNCLASLLRACKFQDQLSP